MPIKRILGTRGIFQLSSRNFDVAENLYVIYMVKGKGGGELLIGTESKVVPVDGGVVYRVMAC